MATVNRYYSSTAVDTTLAVGISASATSLTVSSTTGFPTSYPYTLAIDYDTSLEELVNVVGASGTTLTVGTTVGVADITGRGVDQGAGYRVAHAAGAVVKHVISGRDVREPQEHIAATTNVHGIADTSALVTASSTTTLTNKSLTAPVITGIADVTAGTLALGTTGSITANSATVTAAQLGYVSGATSNLQSQITAKAPTASPTFTGTVTIPTGASITSPNIAGATLTGTITNNATIAGGTGSITSPSVVGGTFSGPNITGSGTLTGSLNIPSASGTAFKIEGSTPGIRGFEVGYLYGLSGNIQDQLNAIGVWQDWSPVTNSSGWTNGAWTNARYCRIGNTVHFRATLNMSGTSTGTSLNVSLPVTAATTAKGVYGTGTGSVSGAGSPTFVLDQTSANAVDVRYMKDFGAAASGIVHAAVTGSLPGSWANASYVTISGTYEAA